MPRLVMSSADRFARIDYLINHLRNRRAGLDITAKQEGDILFAVAVFASWEEAEDNGHLLANAEYDKAKQRTPGL